MRTCPWALENTLLTPKRRMGVMKLVAYFGETLLKVAKNFLRFEMPLSVFWRDTHGKRRLSTSLGSGCYSAQMLPSQPPLPIVVVMMLFSDLVEKRKSISRFLS